MRSSRWTSLGLGVLGSLLTVACQDGAPAARATPAARAESTVTSDNEVLVEVTDHAQVCMVTDRYMGKPQIPVTIGHATYYGCCAGCKSKLEGSATARTATDPVSGASVDKAAATIGRDESGRIFYFESRDNLRKFRPGA